ncbi:MAG TPA: hypothetical protein VJ746_07585 [Nitrospira sp.]|nr:hypothetical protein [Nitrospira sp.]
MTRSVFIVSLLALSACTRSHGLHMAELHDVLRSDAVSFQGTATPSPDEPGRGARIPPILGVYLVPTGFVRHGFEWSDRDRDLVVAWGKGLSSQHTLAGAMALTPSSLKGGTLKEVRHTAARYGADVLLTVEGAAAVDRYNNYKAGLLYWTILGAYLADGTHSDAACVVAGTAWDIKTGARLFSETAEGTAGTIGPAALVNDADEVEHAKRLALDRLLPLLEQRLSRLGP